MITKGEKGDHMEILLVVMLILLVALTAMCAYLYWGKNKKPDPVKPQPTPEKAFEEFRKLVGDNDPESARRLEQIQKCIYYSPELEEGTKQWKA